ncbi:MAG: TonB-dependent receptor [Acidobacteria bacterium]|nr:TonB-dependent receptor [Acidobacteriota bacterium]
MSVLALAATSLIMLSPLADPQARPGTAPRDSAPEMQKAIEEFRVQSRRLGMVEGVAAQVTSTSRKSRWHGRLFENFRNDFLDAVPHEVAQRGGKKNILRRNQFGVNLSGPVWIPKLFDGGRTTFFSLTYEGMREKTGRSSLNTIPTMAERTGDWSQVVDPAGEPLPIFDPASTATNPGYNSTQPLTTSNLQYQRNPFPGNVIPVSRLNPQAVAAAQLYPEPNSTAGPFFRNNYFVFSPEVNSANGFIGRLDHTVDEHHRLGGSFSHSKGLDGAAPVFLNAANPGPVVRDRQSERAGIEHTFTISPQRLNSLSIDVSSDRITNLPETVNGRVYPNYKMGAYLPMGRANAELRSARQVFSIAEGYSMRWRQHRLRMAARWFRDQVNIYSPTYPEGSYRFGSGLTSLPGINNTGHAFASFLLGQAEFAEQSVVQSPSYFRRSRYSLAMSDQWEVLKGLVFSFSLGLEMSGARQEKYDRQSTVALDVINPENGRPGALVAAGVGGQGRTFQPFLCKGEPSLGIAWNPLGGTRTVVRASYGRSYSAIPVYSSQWGTQAFNGSPAWVSPNPQLEPAAILTATVPPGGRTFPDLRPESANNTIADLVESTGKQPTYQSFGLSLERELPSSLLLTVGLGHAHGRNLLLGNSASNPNAIPLSALEYRDQLNDEAFNQAQRPYPQYQRFNIFSSWPEGRYQRDAGYLRLEKRSSSGLVLSTTYEVSKQMDNYSGPYGIQDYYNRSNEWALTSSNNPQRLTLTYSYEIPMGPNRLLFPVTDWRRYIVEGWSVSGVTTIVSGLPLALRPQFNNTGRVVDTLYVDVVPGVDPHAAEQTPERWFNPDAFAQPADFTVGDAARTHPSLRGPGAQNHDLSLNKRISLSIEKSVEFSMVGLNFINHANWADPDTTIGTASAPNVNAGRIISSRGGRVIQLGLRYSF